MKSIINLRSSGEILKDELKVYHTGYQQCTRGYSFGPFVRDHYLIHFILSGKGLYKNGLNSYGLEAGQGFFIFPGERTFYKADEEDPWAYFWIGFHGGEAVDLIKKSGVSLESPIIHFDSKLLEVLETIMKLDNRTIEQQLRIKGYLQLLFAELVRINGTERIVNKDHMAKVYVRQAIEFMSIHYVDPITIEDIANHLGIDRSYFSRLFKTHEGYSPKQYLIEYRIFKAKRLLEQQSLTVSDIARSVGYSDAYSLSKVFSRITGISPTKYRLLHNSGEL
ncbi:AraC family transcriptional regulator [Vallitalea okinawensis]|uniref:AraC family transcriptional regulator n=1 Tax=Vallitalea okinawensis TaxID=2078660 RepID=UPI000CFDB85A|nr:AraC family transcriptional regulator [Vallitalea okinawensis]